MRSSTLPALAALLFFTAGCGLLRRGAPAALTPFVATATLRSTSPSPSTPPPPWPTATSTAVSIEGITITQVNVRGEPSTAGVLLGMLAASSRVQVLGKDPSGNWYQVLYPTGAEGKGWVAAQYVQVKDRDALPVLALASEPSGVITQQVNIRSGPASAFDALGILNPNDVVILNGRDESGLWLRIRLPNAPQGYGWVAAAFVWSDALQSLPIISSGGEMKGTATPGPLPPPVTPTLVAAQPDPDSQPSPAVSLIFSPNGAGALLYSSDLSVPSGDAEDWVQFTPYTPIVVIGLLCEGNGTLQAEIQPEAVPLDGKADLQCNQAGPWHLVAGQTHVVHLRAVGRNGDLQYVRYTLSIETLR